MTVKNPQDAPTGNARPTPLEAISSEIKKSHLALASQLQDLSAQLGLWSSPEERVAELLASHDDKILHTINEQEKFVRENLLTEIAAQRTATEAISQALMMLANLQSSVFNYGHVLPLIPQGPFTMRLYGDSRHVRTQVAKFVVQKFFVERGKKQLCFVQASAMAFNLFEEINSASDVPAHCLFHVNGPVAPLPLLFGQNNGRHSVVLFWGSIFDTHCASYLPHSTDENAEAELKKLFTRSDEPLKTLFLTPRYITPDGRIFYERLESVHFVNSMAEELVRRNDTEIIVLATGDRVTSSVEAIPGEVRPLGALDDVLRRQPQKLTYVVSHPNQETPSFVSDLRQRIGKLWWQDMTQAWMDVPATGS